MIIPGILEQDFNVIERKVKTIDAFVDLIQVDVADGRLVDGKTFLDPRKLDTIKTPAMFELHLMVEDPLLYLREKIQKVERVCVQIEASHIEEFIDKAKEMTYKVGLSLNPETAIEALEPYISKIDYVQFMTVIPGDSGRPFDKEVLNKIEDFKNKHKKFVIQVDGGINFDTIKLVLNKGVSNVVATSQILGQNNPIAALYKFEEIERSFL